jgi:hypothetical protein
MIVVRIGSSIPLLPSGPQSSAVPERAQRPRGEAVSIPEAGARSAEREVVRIRSRVAAARDTQDFSQANLSQRSRNALLSYQANGPTLSERLGVELAGIDVSV